MRTAVCVYVRNEERYIAEWLAFQFVIGFDTVILYDNASSDATPTIAATAGKINDIRIVPWNMTHKLAQISAYRDCINSFHGEFDWIAFFDADEFFIPHSSDSVKDVIERNKDAAAIAINWAIFGSNGLEEYSSDLCISAFTRRSKASLGTNRHYKSIINTKLTRDLESVHGVSDAEGNVRPDGSSFKNQKPGKMLDDADLDICQLNHYFVKSKAHWSDKISRGYRDGTKRSISDFERNDHNQIEDRSAVRFVPAVRELVDQYECGVAQS